MSRYIANPRPMWNPETKKRNETVVFGSKTAGVVVRITKKGIEFNGYYRGLTTEKLYGTMREFMMLEWEDLEKLKRAVQRGKKIPKEVVESPDEIDETPDLEYLETLPQATMNGRKFYIDVERGERRLVDNPTQVFHWKDIV